MDSRCGLFFYGVSDTDMKKARIERFSLFSYLYNNLRPFYYLMYFLRSRRKFRAAGLLFADGGGRKRAKSELQSAAVGRRRTARLAESH